MPRPKKKVKIFRERFHERFPELKPYYCSKCKRKHIAGSKVFREHKRYKR